MLDTQQQKNRPGQIQKFCSKHQRAQRSLRRDPLRSQRNTKVADEHDVPPGEKLLKSDKSVRPQECPTQKNVRPTIGPTHIGTAALL